MPLRAHQHVVHREFRVARGLRHLRDILPDRESTEERRLHPASGYEERGCLLGVTRFERQQILAHRLLHGPPRLDVPVADYTRFFALRRGCRGLCACQAAPAVRLAADLSALKRPVGEYVSRAAWAVQKALRRATKLDCESCSREAEAAK